MVWTALTTTHAPLAFGRGRALHYPRDIAPFSAIAEPTPAAYDDLARDLPPDVEARLVRPREEPSPPGWETLSARPIVQMLAESVPPEAGDLGMPIRDLTAADTADMLALVEAAKPGPFSARTILLGDYLGIRAPETGRLLAMAGERLRLQAIPRSAPSRCTRRRAAAGSASALSAHAHAPDPGGRRACVCMFTRTIRPWRCIIRMGFRERARPWVIWRRSENRL